MQAFRFLTFLFVSTTVPLFLSSCGQDPAPTEQSVVQVPEVDPTKNTELDIESVEDFDQLESSDNESSEVAEEQTDINNNTLFDEYEFATVEDASIADQESENELYCLGLTDTGAETQEMISSACLRISDRLASVTNSGCLAANLRPTQCRSVDQFPILYSEFPPLENKIPQGRILVIGGTHGDELTSVSMIFRWIEKLNKYHSGLFHWHLIPMMNPDGVLRPDATRTNANGVDLNRNLPSNDWTQNALKYWREKTGEDVRRYPGESPSSEPETQWLIDEINTFKPDAIISVHAPYGIVDFDAQVLNSAPKSLGRLLLNLLGTYPGSLGNYAGINRNIPVITLELPHAWVMPSEAETTRLWEDIVRWLRENVNNPELKKEHKSTD